MTRTMLVCAALAALACDAGETGEAANGGDATPRLGDAQATPTPDMGQGDVASQTLDVPVADAGSTDGSEETEDGAPQPPDPDAGEPPLPPDAAVALLDPDASLVPPEADAAPGGEMLPDLIATVAQTTCDALFRCCDEQSRLDFWAVIRFSERAAEFRPRLPPDAEVDEDSCPEVLGAVYDVVPLGPWVAAALRGDVRFDEQAAGECLDTLDEAACGDEVAAALGDGTCFGFSPPYGAGQRRSMFARDNDVGTACVALTDGVGGAFYGTCDPERAFCCDNSQGGCRIVGDGPGVCAQAAQEGEGCGLFPEVTVCATGLDCGLDDRCVVPGDERFAAGEVCAEGFSLLGRCEESWCDIGGSNVCEPLHPLGGDCVLPYECQTGVCADGACAEPTFCR